jgi:tartrate-resistant acid phosphatase type 5
MGQFASDNNPAFALLLGDNFYPDGVSSTTDAQWQTTFEQVYSSTNLDFPFYAVLGNHDYHENENAQVAYTTAVPASRWEMPARYYTFSKTLSDLTIDFFALDTNTIKTEDAQLEWLEDQLSASTADWKIVFAHHPLYSNGVHGTDPALVDRLLPLFEQYGVDLYLCGHDHDLQVLQAVNGVHFLVDGAGSAHRLTRCLDNTLYAASQLGFMAFRVSQQELVLMVILSDGSLDFALEITH